MTSKVRPEKGVWWAVCILETALAFDVLHFYPLCFGEERIWRGWRLCWFLNAFRTLLGVGGVQILIPFIWFNKGLDVPVFHYAGLSVHHV